MVAAVMMTDALEGPPDCECACNEIIKSQMVVCRAEMEGMLFVVRWRAWCRSENLVVKFSPLFFITSSLSELVMEGTVHMVPVVRSAGTTFFITTHGVRCGVRYQFF